MAVSSETTQHFVPIKEIRDGVVVLKDGGVRAILMASSVNLGLKSDDEQKAIIFQFQNFLNSLDFPVQIVVQSRRYDVRPYLVTLENRMHELTEPLLKIQTKEYIEFIRKFNDDVNIMTKTFFVVVSYTSVSLENPLTKIRSFIPGASKATGPTEKTDESVLFEEKRNQLEQRLGVIESGLSRCSVRSARLGTHEIVELFYKTFNPGDASQGLSIGNQES